MKRKSAETRQRMSEARKRFWEKKTPEQRSAITLKSVGTRENSEAESKRRENISRKMRDFYATPEGRLAIEAGVTTYTKIRDARSPERINELSKQKSETTKAIWDNLTVAQRAARVEKVNGGFKKIRFEGNPENHNYESFDAFLKDLLWVHISPKHKKWKYPCHLAEKLASNNRAISVDSETQKGWLLKEARRIPR